MKPSPISVAMLVVSLLFTPTLLAQAPDSANQNAAPPASSSASAAEVPRLIKFGGTLLDAQDRPMAGPLGVTFALYSQQTAGAALWLETQNVKPDANGAYTVLLGANTANGVPAELFASGEARWLEVQVERQPEQPRVLLVSVPYALKAKDAETLGGKPASAFVTTETLAGAGNSAGAIAASPTSSTASTALPSSSTQSTPKKAASTPQPPVACTSVTSNGTATANSVAKFTTACNLQNSAITETGGNVGIGTAAPAVALDILGNNAGLRLSGTGTHQVTVTGATSGRLGQDASGFFFASDSNGKTVRFLTNNGTLNEWMRITSAGDVGIGTTTPAAKLDVNGNVIGTSSNSSTNSAALVGNETATTGQVFGVSGGTSSTTNGAAGVIGFESAATGQVNGVSGGTTSATNGAAGVNGFATATTGMVFGVTGFTQSTTAKAAAVNGFEGATTGQVYGVNGGTNSTGNNSAAVNGYEGATTGQVSGVSGGTNSTTNFASGVSGFEAATTGTVYGVAGTTNSVTDGAAGVSGGENATTGMVYGVAGFSKSATNNAAAVTGFEGATTGAVFGVSGQTSSSTNGAAGVDGNENATTGIVYGVHGFTTSTAGAGVYGQANATTGNTTGVLGGTLSPTGIAALGLSSATSGGTGVQGQTESTSGGAAGLFVAHGGGGLLLNGLTGSSFTQEFSVDASGNGFFAGNLTVTGKVTKGSGSFKIDHPLDPPNKYLSHSFVESPDMMNVYNGNVTTDKHGFATVVLPDYFEALNRDFRYQLTVIGQFAQAIVKQEIENNRFIIQTSKPSVKVSWQVTGIRHDAYANAHRIPVEEQKSPQEQGHYLHPELFGASQEKALASASPALPSAPAALREQR